VKNKFKKLILIGICVSVFTFATGCTIVKELDVISKGSVKSFAAVLDTMSGAGNVDDDASNTGWWIQAPDKTVNFIWGELSSESVPQAYNARLKIDAKPFLDAGLDTSKLPSNIEYHQNDYYEDTLIIGLHLGDYGTTTENQSEEMSDEKAVYAPLSSYEDIVRNYPEVIGYHAAMAHFGVSLGDGNMFEWAKDISANDKDIVFVLNPEPFIAAGVDVSNVEGWVFGKVPMNMDGKMVEVDKLLKPFNLDD
jgi:hypothetical protein